MTQSGGPNGEGSSGDHPDHASRRSRHRKTSPEHTPRSPEPKDQPGSGEDGAQPRAGTSRPPGAKRLTTTHAGARMIRDNDEPRRAQAQFNLGRGGSDDTRDAEVPDASRDSGVDRAGRRASVTLCGRLRWLVPESLLGWSLLGLLLAGAFINHRSSAPLAPGGAAIWSGTLWVGARLLERWVIARIRPTVAVASLIVLVGAVVAVELFQSGSPPALPPEPVGGGLLLLISDPKAAARLTLYQDTAAFASPNDVVLNLQIASTRSTVNWLLLGSDGWRLTAAMATYGQGTEVQPEIALNVTSGADTFPAENVEGLGWELLTLRPRNGSAAGANVLDAIPWLDPDNATMVTGSVNPEEPYGSNFILRLPTPWSATGGGHTLGRIGAIGCPQSLIDWIAFKQGSRHTLTKGYIGGAAADSTWACPKVITVAADAGTLRADEGIDSVDPAPSATGELYWTTTGRSHFSFHLSKPVISHAPGAPPPDIQSAISDVNQFAHVQAPDDRGLTWPGARWRTSVASGVAAASDDAFAAGAVLAVATGALLWLLQLLGGEKMPGRARRRRARPR